MKEKFHLLNSNLDPSSAKSLLMNKYINKDVGINAISSYKRASNITDKAEKGIVGRPDAVLFRTEEEKILFDRHNTAELMSQFLHGEQGALLVASQLAS